MDAVLICLGLSILIVLYLLSKCSTRKKECSKKVQFHVSQPAVVASPGLVKSDFGTGVNKRKFDSRYHDLADAEYAGDYNVLIQYMSLEPEIYESHNQYTSSPGSYVAGASMLSERDDPNDAVMGVKGFNAKPQDVTIGYGVRQETSDYQDQQRTTKYFPIG